MYPSIKFTKEIEKNNELAFLDVLVKKNNGQLQFEVYRKPTQTDLYLNGNSHHHPKHKKAVWSTLIHRALNICSTPESLNRELLHISKTAALNGHSINIPKLVQEIKNSTTANRIKPFGPNKKKIFLPYISGVYESLANVLRKCGLEIVPIPGRKLGGMLSTVKTKKDFLEEPGVYSFSCSDCSKSYIGQTKRMLKTRIKEHKRNIKYGQVEAVDALAVAAHCWNNDHHIDRQPTKRLAPYSGFGRTLFREALKISRCHHPMNNNCGLIQVPAIWKEYFLKEC